MLNARDASLMAALALTAACGGGSNQPTQAQNPAQGSPTPAPVARIEVTPAEALLFPGNTAQFSATLYDSLGRILTGRTVQWVTNGPDAIAMTADGLVTANAISQGPLLAIVMATSEGRSASGRALVERADRAMIASWSFDPPVAVPDASGLVSVTVSARVRSAGPAVTNATALFTAPSSAPTRSCSLSLTAGTTTDGTWSCTMQFSNLAFGHFVLSRISAGFDAISAQGTLYGADMAHMRELPSGVFVAPTGFDTTVPSLAAYSITPAQVPLASARSTSFTMRATGVRTLSSLSTNMGGVSGDLLHGTYPSCTTVEEGAGRRDWTRDCRPSAFIFGSAGLHPVRFVSIEDVGGRVRAYSNRQLLSMGYPAALVVTP